MPLSTGKCTNFGLCARADSREWIEAPLEEFFCPDCGRPLHREKPASGPGRKLILVAGAAVVLAAGGYLVLRPDEQPAVQKTPPTASAWLRVAGSDTMASRLLPALVEAFQAQRGGGQPREIAVAGEGSSTAFVCLQQSTCDIGMSSRPAAPEEGANLTEKVVALDAAVLIVHPSREKTTPTAALAASQLYTRNSQSGTRKWFAGQFGEPPANAIEVRTNAEMVARVQADPRGLGFVSRAFVQGVQALAPEGRPLTRDAIATESHPWARRLFFYLPANPSPAAKEFLDFVVSEAGQDIVEKQGFVGQNIRTLQTVEPPPNAPPEYAGAANIAERLSVDIRFQHNSRVIDSKARDDLERIARILTQRNLRNRKILLFGFADSSGSRPANLTLSRDRAQAVAEALRTRSIHPALVTGFGQDLPVAPNDTEENREKNRRVEVWLRR